eukprot:COSAG06_NODE_2978_length_5994_cov_51.043766_4_plen_87_part_00
MQLAGRCSHAQCARPHGFAYFYLPNAARASKRTQMMAMNSDIYHCDMYEYFLQQLYYLGTKEDTQVELYEHPERRRDLALYGYKTT